ncbi:MAG TPA: FtsX-like permease family protein [Methanobacterium sp.]|nr:FtsX-like permease family protein [Methanobacterium sp.]
MLDIAFKDFKAKKGRAAMCIIGVMVCVLLIGTVNTILYSITSEVKGDLGTVNGKMFFEKNGTSYPPFGSIITEDLGNKVLKSSSVNPQESTKVVLSYMLGNTSDGNTYIVGLTPGKERAFIDNVTVTGSSSLTGQSKNAVILGSDAARKYNVTIGDTFNVSGNKFKVVGIMNKVGTGWPLMIDSSVIMSLSHAQNISNMQGLISTVIIKPSGSNSIDSTVSSLQKAYPKYTIYSQKDAQKTLEENMSQFNIFINMISIFIFIVSIIIIMNVMMMSVKEKTRDIGTMRAIGTKKRSIMALILYESLILSVIGGVLGILLMSPVYNILGSFMGIANVNLLSFTVPPMVLAEVFVIIFVIGTLSGLLPAYLANRISPIEALRYE